MKEDVSEKSELRFSCVVIIDRQTPKISSIGSELEASCYKTSFYSTQYSVCDKADENSHSSPSQCGRPQLSCLCFSQTGCFLLFLAFHSSSFSTGRAVIPVKHNAQSLKKAVSSPFPRGKRRPLNPLSEITNFLQTHAIAGLGEP